MTPSGVTGNANAHHQAGATAKAAINEATRSIARCLGAPPAGIIYTSGASRANNLAVKGLAALGGCSRQAHPLYPAGAFICQRQSGGAAKAGVRGGAAGHPAGRHGGPR
ncbi:MAG: aminotransferase class V-fold PLP-dependent enzyme [Faecalibacterium prausnitzii]